jgi:hypothetical protein
MQVVDMIPPAPTRGLANAGPSFLFAFDISWEAIDAGFTQMAAASILSVLPELSDDCYVTLLAFDHQVTVYNLRQNKRIVICDSEEAVYPSFHTKLGTARITLTNILTGFLTIPITNATKGHCLGVALDVIAAVLKGIGGVALAFISGPPSIGHGAIQPRPTADLNNEPTLLRAAEVPEAQIYRKLGLKLSSASVALHLFIQAQSFVDLPVFSMSVSLTGGRCYLYDDFSVQLHADIARTLTTSYYWNATLRMRFSAGLGMRRMHGNGILRDHDLIVMPSLLPSETYAFELFPQADGIQTADVTFQLTLEWSDETRQRLVRVMTFHFPVSSNPREVAQHFDEGALSAILVKRILHVMATHGTATAANLFVKETKPYQTLKALPEFARSLISSQFLSRADPAEVDKKLATIMSLRSAGIAETLLYCCPRLISIDKGSLKPLREAAFGKAMMILHTADAVFLWAASDKIFGDEVAGAVTPQGFVDVDRLVGARADAIRGIVKNCWELSLRYLVVFPVVGVEGMRRFWRVADRGTVVEVSAPMGEPFGTVAENHVME